MKKFIPSVVFIVLLVALAAAYLQWQAQRHDTATTSQTMEVPTAPSPTTESPGPRYPIPRPPSADQSQMSEPVPPETPAQIPLEPDAVPSPALPALNDSNALMTEVFTTLFGAEPLRALFAPDELVRRFVVTIDNLPNKKLPRQRLLVKRVSGPFQVTGDAGSLVISADNAARYTPYVQLASDVDANQLVAVYVRFYALFQEAYAELGYPNAYFNDRLVDVIDHLLDMPAVDEPLQLVQPKVFYEYAEAELEALSAGQKILLRMGSANAQRVKAKLNEIRQALTGVSMQQGDLEPSVDAAVQPPGAD
jgi:hypothetical protein